MKIKLMIGLLCLSVGLHAMHEDSNKINLLEAMQYELTKTNKNEIVMCRLNLSSPASDSLLREHIKDRAQWRESVASASLDVYMKSIVDNVTDLHQKIEYWTRTFPAYTTDNVNKVEFIMYSVPPSMERERAHPASIEAFKKEEKLFIIVIREDGEDVVVNDLKMLFSHDPLIIFPREKVNNSPLKWKAL